MAITRTEDGHTDYQSKHYIINQKWLQHVQRLDTDRLSKQALQYKSKVPTTCTENGHTDYQNKHYNINQKWLQHVQKMDTQTTKASTIL